MRYKAYGSVLESGIPLPELPPTEQTTPEFTFQLSLPRQQESISVRWFHQWGFSEEKVWLYFGKQEDSYLLRFPDLADFHVSATGKRVRCYPVAEVPLETLRHLFLDQVFPLALSRRGKLVLHASSVMTEGGAISFVGETGAGKSTLAASFAKEGFSFITDDCLLLEENRGQLMAFPGYPGLRLWPDVVSRLFEGELENCDVAHYTDKKRIGIDLTGSSLRFQNDSVHLRKIYFLTSYEPSRNDCPIRITPISPRDTFMELVRHAYKLDIDDRDMLETEFGCLGRIVGLPIFYRLNYPHDLSYFPAVRKAILENLSA
jgi:hypothetical protein